MSDLLQESEKLIIAISNHLRWGIVFQTILVKKDESGSLTILELVGSKSSVFSKLSEQIKDIVLMTEKISDKSLMKLYSKEKNTADFLKKVSIETIEKYIRPFIENYHQKIINALATVELPIFRRDGVRTRVLYNSDRIFISENISQVVFNFIKDNQSGLRYFINVKCEGEPIDLYEKPYCVICAAPAIILIENKIHIFRDIDIKKLTPFFAKKHIDVPASSEKAYIRKFIVNCVERYEVKAQGIDIRQIFPTPKAIISLENDWNMTLALL
jgi:hypothetical protein